MANVARPATVAKQRHGVEPVILREVGMIANALRRVAQNLDFVANSDFLRLEVDEEIDSLDELANQLKKLRAEAGR